MPSIDRHMLGRLVSGRAAGEVDPGAFSAAEWELWLQAAQMEGVGPLLYWQLRQSGEIATAPGPIRKALSAMYAGTRMSNEQAVAEVKALATRFDRADIPVAALKGICSALTLYPDLGLRPMSDVDLLVPTPDLLEALRIARASGYGGGRPEASPGLDELLSHHVCLSKDSAPFTVLELHDALVAEGAVTYAVPVDWFWSQVEPLPGSEPLLMLSPTAQLLYASAHAMLQHGGRNTSLRWLYDLDRLIRHYGERIDWDLLVSRARAFEWSSAVSAALAETNACFGTPVPARALAELSGQKDRNTQRVQSLLRRPLTHTLEEYQKLQSLSTYARLWLTLALLAPAPAYMRWRYGLKNNWALPAWYLYRWWGIFKDAVKTLWLVTQKRVVPEK